MDTTFRKYRSKGEVWQLGWHREPTWTAEEDGRLWRPSILVCLSLRTGRYEFSGHDAGEPGPEAFRDLVMRTARTWRLRPERIEVTDAGVAEDLRGFLSREKVAVELRSDLPELRALQEERVRALRSAMPPAALDAPGVTVERLAAFAGAAARFAAAAPWRLLALDDILLLEADGLPPELGEAQVLGPPFGAGVRFLRPLSEEGTAKALVEDTEDLDFDEDELDWEDDWSDEDGLWKLTFVSPPDLPPEDVELWLEHGLPLAHPGAYPLALSCLSSERPAGGLLHWLEVVLDALASTTEEEMDTGRWEKEVVTLNGAVRLSLTLPDVLLPPYAESLPPDEGGELPDEMALAVELTTEAFESLGRRQIHLARRAVALWPGCFDAWYLLARRALDPETARDLYGKALAAGERLMPGIERREEPLAEDERRFAASYFWARSGLARTLWSLGAREEALVHLRWLLAVEPEEPDNAWSLAHALLALGRDEEAEVLLDRYADSEPDWLYFRALLAFRREPDSPSTRRQMAFALLEDRRFGEQLLRGVRPDEIEEESLDFPVQEVWRDTPGALEALRTENAMLASAARVWAAKRKGEKKKRGRR